VSDELPRVRFITALVADDIRREASGKEIIIGVYTARIILAGVSAEGGMVLAISLLFESLGIGDIPIQLRIMGPSGESVGMMNALIHSEESNVSGQINALSFAGMPVPIQSEGNIVIEARQHDDKEWQTVRVLPVTVNPESPGLKVGVPSPSSIVIEQRSVPQPSVEPETSSPPAPSRPARPTRPRRS
jgi:hypothetical protein